MKHLLAVVLAIAPLVSFGDEVSSKIQRCGVMGRVAGYVQTARQSGSSQTSKSIDLYMAERATTIKALVDDGKITVQEGHDRLTFAEEMALEVFSLPVAVEPSYVQSRVQSRCLNR